MSKTSEEWQATRALAEQLLMTELQTNTQGVANRSFELLELLNDAYGGVTMESLTALYMIAMSHAPRVASLEIKH